MLPKLIAFLVSVVVVLAASGWQAWQLWQIKSGNFLDRSSLALKSTTLQGKSPGLVQIAGQHLFGNPAERPAAEPEKPEALPPTDLKFVLVGAITDSDPKKASALIQADKDTKRYFVGDDIRGQAVLHEVSSNAVVLKRGNRFEQLEFPKGGELNPEAREAIQKITGKTVVHPTAKSVAAAPPAAQSQQQDSGNSQSQPGKSSGGEEKTGGVEKTGSTLRDRLQKRPKTVQPNKPAN